MSKKASLSLSPPSPSFQGEKKRIFGICAHPVAHSLSPPMQQAGFDALGIDADFLRFDVSPEELKSFFQRVRTEQISGLAVSLPHKEGILSLVDELTENARVIGAANTVFWREGKLWAENTDAMGFWNAVNPHLSQTAKKAAVIGAGGAARALVYVLVQKGFEVILCNRTLAKANSLAEAFGAQVCPLEDFAARDVDLVVNATSVGLKEDKSPLPVSAWEGFSGLAFDAVFDPLETRFLREAKAAGAKMVTGETMLLEQGLLQFEIWTGKEAPREAMERGLREALEKVCKI